MLFLFYLFFLISSWIPFSPVFAEDTTNLTPISAYRKGQYRITTEQLANKAKKTPEEYYLLGQSYLELRRYGDAVNTFSQIDFRSFATNKETAFLYPFFVDSFMTAGIRQNIIQQPLGTDTDILTMTALVPATSPIRAAIDGKFLNFLWKDKNYIAITIANTNLSPQGLVWIELAKQAQGFPFNPNVLIEGSRGFKDTNVFEDMLQAVETKKILNAKQAKVFAKLAVNITNLQDKAVEFAQRYEVLSKDKNFIITIKSRILANKGELDAAAKIYYDYIKIKKNVPVEFYRTALQHLIRRDMIDEALDVGEWGYKQHGFVFSSEYTTILETHKKDTVIFSWYSKNYKRPSEEMHNQATRSLLRTTNLVLTEKAISMGLSINSNFVTLLMLNGIIKERLDKKEEAYKNYLKVIFMEPFSYTGVVVRPKEKALRSQFRSLFDAKIAQTLPLLTNASLSQRLLLAKMFLLDDELKQYVNINNLRKDQAELDAKVKKELQISPIPELENIDLRLTNFAPEMQAYLENTIDAYARKSSDPSAKVKYYYKYSKLFIDTEIIGYMTFQIFFYLRNMYGATYMPIFSQELLALAYPKPEWDFILKESGRDEDLAYWMISSFHQESHFRKRVFSQVGAVGFAQVMGYTAKDIKNWMKRPELENTDFMDNLTMGVYYHDRMYRYHDNNHVYAMAAYNAGSNRVKRWRSRFAAYENEIALFTESIDIRETRNYVRIVTYNRNMYDLINNKKELWPENKWISFDK